MSIKLLSIRTAASMAVLLLVAAVHLAGIARGAGPAANLAQTPAVASDADDYFTIVALPDPQNYSDRYPQTFFKQTAWARDNAQAERIVFVTALGDLVQHYGSKPNEWDVADKALSVLDGTVPWGVTIGNHDFDKWGDKHRAATNFLRHFGPERFTGQPWFGGASDNGLSTYQIIEAAGMKLLILHLEIAPPEAAMDWARGVLADHADLPTILVTHIYLDDRTRARDTTPASYLGQGSHSGEQIWKGLVAKRPQIFMVLCGHWALAGGQHHQTSINNAGGKVHEILSDFQERKDGGEGYLRVMRFVPARKEIQVRTYSPVLDRYLTDKASQFTLPFDVESLKQTLGNTPMKATAGK